MKSHRIDRKRRGYSLIEALVVITSVATVFGMLGVLIHGMLDLDRADRRNLIAASTVQSLGRALRGDAHAASGNPNVEPTKLGLALQDGTSVEYRVEPGRVARTLIRLDKTKHHDVFNLPARVSAKFETRGDDSKGRRLALILDQPESLDRPALGPYRDFVIEAASALNSKNRGGSK